MYVRHYMDSDVINRLKYLITYLCVNSRKKGSNHFRIIITSNISAVEQIWILNTTVRVYLMDLNLSVFGGGDSPKL